MHCIRCLVLLFRVCSLKIRVRHYRCRSHSHISNLHVSAALIMSISMPHPPLQEHSFLTIIHTSASTFLQPYLLSSTKPIKQHISLPLSGREQIQIHHSLLLYYPDLHAGIDLQRNTHQPTICLTITPSGPKMPSAPIRPVTWILALLSGVSTATDLLLLPTLSSSFSSVSLVLSTHILASDGRVGVS